jgi:YVTN family beta-propeller protein
LCYSYLNSYVGSVLAQDKKQSEPEMINYESPHVHPIDASPDGTKLAVCNTTDGHVEIFSTTGDELELVRSVRVGLDPVTVRFRNDSELWVVNHVSDSVNIIDLTNYTVVNTLSVGDEPADLVFAEDPQRVYVTCSSENKVLIYDPGNLKTQPEVITIEGEDPRSLAVSPDGTKVYVAVFESGNSTTVLAGGIENEAMMSYPPNVVSPQISYGGVGTNITANFCGRFIDSPPLFPL